MERVVQVLVNTTKKVVQVLVNTTKKVVQVLVNTEEVAKWLGVIGPELLPFVVLKCFLGETGWIASVVIFILEIIINLKPWKKD